MARPRKLNVAKQGNRTKEELNESELIENGLEQFESIDLENVPKDLTEDAQKEWSRVVPLLEQLPIADLDYDRIKRYCQLVAIVDEAYRHIAKYGAVNEDNTKKTAQFMVYMDGLKELKSICSSLGMTIDSRMRLVVPLEKDKAKSINDEFGIDDDD
ncbi:phage terminase small subunit P27 family [Mammaliicoccus fleurettii]|uniref:Phage terminase small subunit P27 family n=1 Tax=Mammaliicoccus fleurettii TaxID=150056 RepID=A0ABS5MK42_9STAP|nr:phage terminase small subunit P27 family [Mammaliicoccus fleurettii]MBL0846539.1 phage terminase small subunit P27 family [Mammaliicoccus fleurettii]MBS3670980.1 phage terminase small subunit P27 family [Mammaliicoccus fleurettii]MBS3696039.1 phage terminase small subunit P27 family [Mammaliicoccus fleurettii]